MSSSSSHFDRFGLSTFSFDGRNDEDRPHRHPEIEILVLENQSFHWRFGDHIHILQPDQLYVFWGIREHQAVHPDSTATAQGIRLPLSWVLPWNLPRQFIGGILRGDLIISPSPTEPCSDLANVNAWKNLLEGGNSQGDTIAMEAVLFQIRARFLLIASEMIQQGGSTQTKGLAPNSAMARFEKLTRMMIENYHARIQIPEIAEGAGMHHASAMRLFRSLDFHPRMRPVYKTHVFFQQSF